MDIAESSEDRQVVRYRSDCRSCCIEVTGNDEKSYFGGRNGVQNLVKERMNWWDKCAHRACILKAELFCFALFSCCLSSCMITGPKITPIQSTE